MLQLLPLMLCNYLHPLNYPLQQHMSILPQRNQPHPWHQFHYNTCSHHARIGGFFNWSWQDQNQATHRSSTQILCHQFFGLFHEESWPDLWATVLCPLWCPYEWGFKGAPLDSISRVISTKIDCFDNTTRLYASMPKSKRDDQINFRKIIKTDLVSTPSAVPHPTNYPSPSELPKKTQAQIFHFFSNKFGLSCSIARPVCVRCLKTAPSQIRKGVLLWIHEASIGCHQVTDSIKKLPVQGWII